MSTSSTTGNTSATFTGNSSFSTDLQNVITRAVGIASLPLTQLQNEQSTLADQQSELQTLGTDFQAVQSSIDALNSAVGSGSYAATVDTPSVATASLSSGELAGTYSVTVSNIGSQTNTLSPAGLTTVSDPSSANIAAGSAFTLTVAASSTSAAKSYQITDSSASLNGLVQAINSSGANVQATVVNVGGSASPDYRLSIQGSDYGPTTIQLNAGTTASGANLVPTLTPGSNVTYQVNGQLTNVTSTSRSLAISTGLTVNVLGTGTANITVAENSDGVSTALSNFVASFNTAADELTKNRGQNGGALAGDSIIAELSSSLQSLAEYSGSSNTVNSLTGLGVTYDTNGHLQFDATAFNQATSTSQSDVLNFLGSETTGGFLQTASTTLTALTNATSGLITDASNSIGTSIINLTTEIGNKQDYIAQMQTNLTAQMAAADAAISSLESQVTEITDLFAAQAQASKNITG